jgi:signal transduction histidine kinase
LPLTVAVEHVTATGELTADLGTRKHRDGNDELGRLAESFSVPMRALDDSLQAQRRLVADASHELRTPLTSLTTNLDLLDEISANPDPMAPEPARPYSAALRWTMASYSCSCVIGGSGMGCARSARYASSMR